MSVTINPLNWFKPQTSPVPGSAEVLLYERRHADIDRVNRALLPLLALGTLAAIGAGCDADAIAAVLLWSIACLVVGATIGFLFGIPRSGGNAPKAANANSTAPATNTLVAAAATPAPATGESGNGARPNTNLEEVSDWLTKILVGLSLVHLKTIEAHVLAISRKAAASLNAVPTASDISVATALVIGFTVLGFLFGYLYTRLFLQGAFSRSDNEMGVFRRRVNIELSQPVSGVQPDEGKPSIPSDSDRASAERVMRAAPADRPDAVLGPLRALALEYEKVRNDMPPGSARTRKMSEIATGMKRLALAAQPYLQELTRSASPGERLAAVVILQMKFDPAYIEWLAKCLVEEPAFCGFLAASALLARVNAVGDVERARIKAAVEAAKAKREAMQLRADSGRDGLMKQILEA